jgi:hypothetical protein
MSINRASKYQNDNIMDAARFVAELISSPNVFSQRFPEQSLSPVDNDNDTSFINRLQHQTSNKSWA